MRANLVFKANICNSNLCFWGFCKRLLKQFFEEKKNVCCYNQWFLDFFHVKDPQNYMYLAADPHLKICCSRDPSEAKIRVKRVRFKNMYIQRFAHMIFQRYQIYELVYLRSLNIAKV